MGIEKVKKPTYKILDQNSTFPYIPEKQLSGLSIVNNGEDLLKVVINDGIENITINCTTNARTFDGDFHDIRSIDIISGTIFQIELRGTS